MQIGPLIPSVSFRPEVERAAATHRPTFAEHLRQVAQEAVLAPSPDASIPFGQYLAEVNRVDRQAARLAELWAPSTPGRRAKDDRDETLGVLERSRAASVAPISPECRPAAPQVVAVYQPPVVLHRGARLDLLG